MSKWMCDLFEWTDGELSMVIDRDVSLGYP